MNQEHIELSDGLADELMQPPMQISAFLAAKELRRLSAENEALRAALAAVRFQCEADAKAGEWTTSITKLLDAIKVVEEGK